MRKICVLFTVVLGLALLPATASALDFKPAAGDPITVAAPNDVITDVTTGNFNGDIYDDIAAVGSGNKIYVWFTQADGTFQAAPGSPFGTSTGDTVELYKVFAVDLTNDSRDDLIVQSGSFPGTFLTYFNSGTGTFPSTQDGTWAVDHTGPPNYRGAAFGDSATVADLTNDGCPDLLVGMFESSYQVGVSNCNGGFTRATASPVPVSTPLTGSFDGFTSTAAGDYNGDGVMDIALMLQASDNSGNGRQIYTAEGIGSGVYTTPQVRSSPSGGAGDNLRQIETADINGDEFDDLVSLQTNGDSTETITTLVGSQLGLFPNPNPSRALSESFRGVRYFGIGDVDGDEDQDIAVAFRGSREFGFGIGDGDGGFTWNPNQWALDPIGGKNFYPNEVELPDLNGDGFADFVTSGSHSGDPNQARGIHALVSSPSVGVDKSEIEFPETPVGQESSDTITITGNSGPPASFSNASFTIVGGGNVHFDVANDCPGSLASGDTCDLDVTFDPSFDGEFSSSLQIDVPGGDDLTIPLSGVTGHEDLEVNSPDGSSFELPGGSNGGELTFEVESSGTWPTKVNDIHVYADFEEQDDRWSVIDTNNCKTTLQPGQTCEFDVHFGPKLEDSGSTIAGYLVIESDNNDLSGLYEELSGKATTSAYDLNPLALEFGDREIGAGPSTVKQFTLDPTGDGPTPFYGVKLQGDDESSFTITGAENCPSMIPADSNCTFKVAFDPKGGPGFKQTKVAVMAYNNNGGEYFVNVNGTAIHADPPLPPGPEADLRLKVKSAKKVKAGKKLLVTAAIKNVGDAASFPVVLKATGPKKLTKPVKSQTIQTVRIGETLSRKFMVPVKRNAKGRFKVRVTMTHDGLTSTQLSAQTGNVKIQKKPKKR